MSKKKRKLNIKRIVIFIIILVLIISGIILLVRKNTKNGVQSVNPNIDINEIREEQEGLLKYENNIECIKVGDREGVKRDNKYYIKIEITNSTEEDKFDLPIGIEFINSDGENIFQTGHVQNVLLKGMTDDIYAEVTPEIVKMINNKEIDHIVIKELE